MMNRISPEPHFRTVGGASENEYDSRIGAGRSGTLSAPALVAENAWQSTPEDNLSLFENDPIWAKLIRDSPNPQRIRHTLVELRHSYPKGLSPALSALATILVKTAGTGRGAGAGEGFVGSAAIGNILKLFSSASPKLLGKLNQKLITCASSLHRAVMLKAMGYRSASLEAGGAMGIQSMIELDALGKMLREQSPNELLEHITVYGLAEANGLESSFRNSCVPTTALLLRAEQDPYLALRLNGATGEDLSTEIQILDLAERGAEGIRKGIWGLVDIALMGGAAIMAPMTLEHTRLPLLDSSGRAYETLAWHKIPARERQEHLLQFESILDNGEDLAIRSADALNGQGHVEAVVDVRTTPGGEREWRVHDTINGQSRWLGDAYFLGVSVDERQVTHIYSP